MTEREKVIKGLECCIEQGLSDGADCRKCSYYTTSARLTCWISLLYNAHELLKAQEPRVMTLEDVEEGKPYWLEMRGAISEYVICNLNDHGDSAFLDFATQFGNKTLESDGYGKTWRCWTSRPTDKQMEAVKWKPF